MSALSPLSGISDLTQALFKRADKNGDQKMSVDEFKAFLNSFLGELSRTDQTLPARAASGAGVSAAATSGGANTDGYAYAPIQGFDYAKLCDPTHVNDKYSASVRLFSQALAATGAQPNGDGMQAIVDWLNAHGATASAKNDMLTINGDPPVDVVTDFGGNQSSWWFHNLP